MMRYFNQIGFGDVENKTSEELNGSVIIGFDIDWASDFVLEDALLLASECGIKPILFLTHGSSLIHKLFKRKQYDFGLHPNFEKLLNGDDSNGLDAADVLNRLMLEFPGVDVVRSHSLTTSSRLKALFKDNNFSFESSFITHGTEKKFPNFWREWTGMLHVPITWEDDVWFTLNENYNDTARSNILKPDALNVLTFHPIHLFLNTTDALHYENSRKFFNDPQELIKHRNERETGVRTIFRYIGEKISGGADIINQ